jgi:hypothetical protein
VGRLWLGSWNLPVFDKYKGAGAVALALIRNFSSGFKMQFNFDSSALDSSSKRIFSKNFLKSVINRMEPEFLMFGSGYGRRFNFSSLAPQNSIKCHLSRGAGFP